MEQVTLRVSALCIRDGEVLLIEHKSFAPDDPAFPASYWILPGGRVERGGDASGCPLSRDDGGDGAQLQRWQHAFVKELLYPPSRCTGAGKPPPFSVAGFPLRGDRRRDNNGEGS